MPEIARSTHDMISGMTPKLCPGTFVFVTVKDGALAEEFLAGAIALFKEDEGISLVLPLELAEKARMRVENPMRCITLNVYSSLEGIGLTAAVSTALGDNGIACNMIAAYHHDHVFVPAEACDRALEVLTSLQAKAAETS